MNKIEVVTREQSLRHLHVAKDGSFFYHKLILERMIVMINVQEQFKIIIKVVNLVGSEENLIKKLEKNIITGTPLIVKLGL